MTEEKHDLIVFVIVVVAFVLITFSEIFNVTV